MLHRFDFCESDISLKLPFTWWPDIEWPRDEISTKTCRRDGKMCQRDEGLAFKHPLPVCFGSVWTLTNIWNIYIPPRGRYPMNVAWLCKSSFCNLSPFELDVIFLTCELNVTPPCADRLAQMKMSALKVTRNRHRTCSHQNKNQFMELL